MDNEQILKFSETLLKKRRKYNCNASIRDAAIDFLHQMIDLLFPHFSSKLYYTVEDVAAKLQLLQRDFVTLLKLLESPSEEKSEDIAKVYFSKLSTIHDVLWQDAEFILNGDPAAESIDEVIVAYPGFKAIVIYRLAHQLYNLGIPILPRILTEYGHEKTGVDIHPGAVIASPFFIDHGTGIVIGETSIIGKNVKIYQGVTLGALSVDKSLAEVKRHPTIEENVIIYSQAVILGGETIIGNNSIIGGNTWITQSIPPNSVVYNKSESRIRSNKEDNEPINFII